MASPALGIISPEIMEWVIIPLLIFIARLSDVTLATIRNVFINRGFRKLVPLIGFFEVLIWLIAMRQVMNHVGNFASYIGWAGGFATGTYVGMRIEERLALGTQVIRIITSRDSTALIAELRAAHHGLTIVDAHGAMGPVKMIFTVVKRKNVPDITRILHEHHPGAFYSVEDVRSAAHGVFSGGESRLSKLRNLFPARKGK